MYIQVILSTLLAVSSADPFYTNYGSHRSLPYVYTAGVRSGYITPVVRTVATAPVAHVATVAHVTRVAPVAPVAPAVRVAPVAPVAPAVRVAPVVAKAPVARVAPVVAPVAPAVRAAPVAAVAPVAAAAPVAVSVKSSALPSVHSSQFHSQDEAGNFAFGYNNVNGAREESGNVDTGVMGSYTDKAQGRQINYVADRSGFRVV